MCSIRVTFGLVFGMVIGLGVGFFKRQTNSKIALFVFVYIGVQYSDGFHLMVLFIYLYLFALNSVT